MNTGIDTSDMVSMPSGEDWLMQPVLAGLCNYESLKNGTLDLVDIARMIDALNVSRYNEWTASRRKG